MKLKFPANRRTFIVVFIILLVVSELLVTVNMIQRPTEQFMQLQILGANRLAADYYPNNYPDISLGERVVWYLRATNNMGNVQLISIQVKMSNQTMQSPNDELAVESPAPLVTEFPQFLLDNQTWEVPFVWSISNATDVRGSTQILTLQIDNETYRISNWSANNGYNFRLIFELWTWQTTSNTFQFGWTTNGERRAAWLQIWFNFTSVLPPP
jgi:hypothetical protein